MKFALKLLVLVLFLAFCVWSFNYVYEKRQHAENASLTEQVERLSEDNKVLLSGLSMVVKEDQKKNIHDNLIIQFPEYDPNNIDFLIEKKK